MRKWHNSNNPTNAGLPCIPRFWSRSSPANNQLFCWAFLLSALCWHLPARVKLTRLQHQLGRFEREDCFSPAGSAKPLGFRDCWSIDIQSGICLVLQPYLDMQFVPMICNDHLLRLLNDLLTSPKWGFSPFCCLLSPCFADNTTILGDFLAVSGRQMDLQL